MLDSLSSPGSVYLFSSICQLQIGTSRGINALCCPRLSFLCKILFKLTCVVMAIVRNRNHIYRSTFEDPSVGGSVHNSRNVNKS